MLEDIRCRCLVPLLIKGSSGFELPRWGLFSEGCGISLIILALMKASIAIDEVFRISELFIIFCPCLFCKCVEAHLRASMALLSHWSSLSTAVRL